MSEPAEAPPGSPPPTSWREILRLALPAMASGFATVAYAWVDQIWVGRIAGRGAAPVAALAVAMFGVWALGALSALPSAGIGAVVGRYVGAGREGAARYVAANGLRFAALVGLLVGGVGLLFAPRFAAATGVTEEVQAMGVGYLRAYYAAAVAVLTQSACDAVFRAHGDTRTPLLVTLGALGTNALLDPAFIFGFGPIPALGVAGAGVATAVSIGLAVVVSLVLLGRRGFLARVRPSDDELRLDPTTPIAHGPLPGVDLAVVRRVVRVGAPPAVGGLFFVGIYLALSSLVTRAGGDAAQAALGAGLRGEQVSFFMGLGFSVAATSLVARRLGAGRPDDAQRAAWRATAAATVLCAVWGACLLLLAEPLARLFIPDPAAHEARAYAASFYRIVAPCLLFQTWEHVLDGAFSGAGLTLPPTAVSVGLTAIRIPICSYVALDRGGGVESIWIVIAVTAALRGVFTALWFSRGTWKHRRV